MEAQRIELSAMHAELRELKDQKGPAEPSAAVVPENPAPRPEAVRAMEVASQLIDDALRARRWTDRDVQTFRRELSQLDNEEREALKQRLMVNMNHGELKVETSGVPF